MPLVDDRERAVVAELAGRLQEGATTPLRPGKDGSNLETIVTFLELAGKTFDRYPALYQDMKRAAYESPPDSPGDRAQVVDLGRTSGGTTTSTSFVALPGMPYIAGATTVVLDEVDLTPLALGSSTEVASGVVTVHTDPATAAPARESMKALTFYHAQNSPKELPRFGAVIETVSTEVGGEATVVDPRPRLAGHRETVIGIGRTGEPPDCDYWFGEVQNLDSPNLVVPFKGSRPVPYEMKIDSATGLLDGLKMDSSIWLPHSDSGVSRATALQELAKHVTAVNTPGERTVQWDFTVATSPIFYGPADSVRDTTSLFFFKFSIPRQPSGPDDHPPPFVFTVCSYDFPGSSDACTHIPHLFFTWHCVAAGSLVTLEDGSQLPIEDVAAGKRVRTGIGEGTLAVEANWRGKHRRKVVRLRTADGRRLTLTRHHPVVTPVGMVLAEDLQPGDHVLVDGGSDTIEDARRVRDERAFWTLRLGDAEDRSSGRSHGPGSYVANGIVVADLDAQRAHHRATRRNFDYMKARLPKEVHQDYASALADLAR